MSFLKDKNDRRLDEGDFVDVRARIEKIDETGSRLVLRMGGGQLGMGIGTTNPSPDSSVTFQVRPGDVAKV